MKQLENCWYFVWAPPSSLFCGFTILLSLIGQVDFQGDPFSEQLILVFLSFIIYLFASRWSSRFEIIPTSGYGPTSDAIPTFAYAFIKIIFGLEGQIFLCEGREATLISCFPLTQPTTYFFVPEKTSTIFIVPSQ